MQLQLVVVILDFPEILNSVEVYSPNGGCNFEVAPLPVEVYEHFLIFYRGNLYACGGSEENKCWR